MLKNSQHKYTFAAVVYCIFVTTIFLFIRSYAVNWPRGDDFISIQWYDDLVNKGMFSPSYLLSMRDSSHPLATQGLLTTALLAIAGFDFKSLIILNTVIEIAAALTLTYFFVKNVGSPALAVFASFSLLLVFFHPVHISLLLWAFGLGWFLVNLVLVGNAVLIESSLKYKLLAVFFLCLIGAFSAAQGAMLWAAVGLHLFIRGDKNYKYQVPVFIVPFILNVLYVSSITPNDIRGLHISDAYNFSIYFLQILGVIFCQRNHSWILWQGSVVGALAGTFLLHAFRVRRTRAIQRVALVLISVSLIFLLEFARGRFQYGIDWALGDFHMGTLLIPLMAGIVISSLDWLSSLPGSSRAGRLALLAPGLYILASVSYSIPEAVRSANGVKLAEELARHFACQESAPPYVLYGLNLDLQHAALYRRSIPFLTGHCSLPDSAETTRLLQYPRYFQIIAAQQPDARGALQALWQVYLVHFDLSRAFPPTDQQQGEELLQFAANNARTGSNYAPDMLKPFAPVFVSLADHPETPR